MKEHQAEYVPWKQMQQILPPGVKYQGFSNMLQLTRNEVKDKGVVSSRSISQLLKNTDRELMLATSKVIHGGPVGYKSTMPTGAVTERSAIRKANATSALSKTTLPDMSISGMSQTFSK